MKNEEIQALVLDLGEVLIRLDFSQIMQLRGLGKPDIHESLDQMNRWKIYDSFERGELTEAEFLSTLSLKLGKEISLQEFLPLWNSVLKETVPGVEELIRTLSKCIPLYALTNSNETHIRHVIAHYPWLSHFRHVYTSFELKARKPEQTIYRSLASHLKIPENRILFIDDRKENVEGASLAGFQSEWCEQSPRDLIRILSSYHLIPA